MTNLPIKKGGCSIGMGDFQSVWICCLTPYTSLAHQWLPVPMFIFSGRSCKTITFL